ncbi:hypothetical protein JK636_16795 [Clostridium sp. YIM B02515]|uniref:DUF669 domain-containing protein n=1 Tax=Clostridium rhizosphaerae TaxID=2803861 RepID=A0ABS1TDE1_9CLOT|nr:hypothetical protein [Clostridium rhizosphaerae]MBL4937380.1 hypothetical protein [Clostridium rhizosphaerae]
MRIKIINEKLSNYNDEYKVQGMNYDMVVVDDNNERTAVNIEDVELIPETDIDKLIVSYSDILKVKLNNYISAALYAALIEGIEGETNSRLDSLEVLKDEYKISKRGVWDKRLVLVVNNSIPLDVTIIGEKYADKFSITFKEINLNDFIEGCFENIKHIKREIEEKEKSVDRYKHMLNDVLKNSVASENNSKNKLVSGM